MKIITKITAALAALGLVSQALANPTASGGTVYLTGSSAFRSAVYNALADDSGDAGAVFASGTVQYGTWGNSNPGSANYMVFYGTLKGTSTTVYIDCAWSGSEAGIASACNTTLGNTDRNGNPLTLAGSPETWVDVTTCSLGSVGGSGYLSAYNPVANGQSITNGAQFEASSHGADLAQADTSQTVSWTPYVAGTQTGLIDFGSEGVVTFTISKNVNPAPTQAYLDCTNITIPQLNIITADGWAPASFIDGNPADSLTSVYLVGRNRGSGTRMNYLSCSTYGAHNTVKQFSIGYGCGDPGDPSQTPTTLWLTNEVNNGYESGGSLAKALADTGGSDSAGSCQQADPFKNIAPYNTGDTNWFAFGYLSPADALSTGNNGGQSTPLYCNTNYWLLVDGVFSDNQNIENGSWWFWGHEHLYGRYNIAGSTAQTVGTTLFSAVQGQISTLGTAPGGHDLGIPYSLMQVTKSSDTSFPTF